VLSDLEEMTKRRGGVDSTATIPGQIGDRELPRPHSWSPGSNPSGVGA
jgi:hypothetical protein